MPREEEDRNRESINISWGAEFRERDHLEQRPERGLTARPPEDWDTQANSINPQRPLGGLIVDNQGTVLAFDRSMERLTGWDAADVVGQNKDLALLDPPFGFGISHPIPRPLFEGQLLSPEVPAVQRLTLTRRDGIKLDVEALVSPLGGKGHRINIEIQKILARMGVADVAEVTHDIDPLTGLPSRLTFEDRLQATMTEARRCGHPLGLLLVDIDHLADINDAFGWEQGNQVLRHVAGILSASVRHSDLVARLGDDNFAVLLTGAGRGDARHVAGRIRQAIEGFDFSILPGTQALSVTASLGLSCFPADASVPSELIRRSSDALNEAHRLGRNRVWCYTRRPRVPVQVPVFFDSPGTPVLGQSRDLSNSGIFIDTGDVLTTGMRLGITFQLPDQHESVHMIGRVVRSLSSTTGSGGEAPGGIGVEFERYSDGDRWRLEAFLIDRLERSTTD